MKRSLFPLLLISASVIASAQSKFDAGTQLLLNNYEILKANPDARLIDVIDSPVKLNPRSRAEVKIPVLITMAPGVSAAELEQYGVDVIESAGDIAIADATPEALNELAGTDLIRFVTLSKKAEPMLDKARPSVGLEAIHAGTDMPASYTGKGVICGIYDTGIDANHINFYNSDFTGSRVRAVYHFSRENGSSTVYGEDGEREVSEFTTDSRTGTHGTHTLGCMAGGLRLKNGNENATRPEIGFRTSDWVTRTDVPKQRNTPGAKVQFPYYGAAPDADILISCGQLYASNYNAGIARMARFAQSKGQPCVINMSFGSLGGSHDIYGSEAKFLDNLAEETGAIIFLAAGNDGDLKNTTIKTFTATDNELKFFVSKTGESTISVYADDNNPLTITPVIYNLSEQKVMEELTTSKNGTTVYAGSTYTNPDYIHTNIFSSSFANDCFVMVNSGKDFNGGTRYGAEISMRITNNTTTNKDGNRVVGIIVKGTNGQRVDAVVRQADRQMTSRGIPGWTDGDATMSINSLAGGENIIVVGAYNTRYGWVPFDKANGWIYYSGEGIATDEIAGYSSYGTLYDGRTLPDVCAPGTGICSSYSSYYTANSGLNTSNNSTLAWCKFQGRNYPFAIEQGTSMATPIVAGSVATWLEADPTLTVGEVKDLIRRSSVNDSFTASTGSKAQWGAGKFNALAGLREILVAGVSDISLDRNDIIVTPEADGYAVTAPNAGSVSLRLYDLRGVAVASADADGQDARISTSGIAKGVYILNVNGSHSQRVLVK